MSLRCRRFLIADDGTLCRVANARFDRMLRDPASHRLHVFAGQRVRMADVVVEVVDRVPVRVIRSTFAILAIDDDGRIGSSKFVRQQFALAETALAPVLAVSESNNGVIDATARFVAQGGSWAPSLTLARAIEDAALGRLRCRRL
jgi:Tfp pilus assembly protein PilW